MRDGLLHDFGALQNERQDEFAAAESVADVLHRGQQNLVEHVDRRAASAALRRSSLRCRLCADAELRGGCALRSAHFDRRLARLAAAALSAGAAFEVLDEARQRVGAAIEDEVVAELANVGVDLEVRHDIVGMDERAVEPRLHAMMEEDGVERRARGGLQAERDVRNSQRRQNAGQLALDGANALDRFDRRVAKLRFAGGERKRQRVEDQRARREGRTPLPRSRRCGARLRACAPRVFAIPVSSMVSAIDGRAVFARQRQDGIDFARGPTPRCTELRIARPA